MVKRGLPGVVSDGAMPSSPLSKGAKQVFAKPLLSKQTPSIVVMGTKKKPTSR